MNAQIYQATNILEDVQRMQQQDQQANRQVSSEFSKVESSITPPQKIKVVNDSGSIRSNGMII